MNNQSATPNHALQRTAPCVTAPASAATFPPTMQVPRRAPQSLSLRSLGVAARTMRTNVISLLFFALLCATPLYADTMVRLQDGTINSVDTAKRTVSVVLTPTQSERDSPPSKTNPMEVTDDTKLLIVTSTNGRKKTTIAALKPGMHVQFSGIWGWRMNRAFEIRVLPR